MVTNVETRFCMKGDARTISVFSDFFLYRVIIYYFNITLNLLCTTLSLLYIKNFFVCYTRQIRLNGELLSVVSGYFKNTSFHAECVDWKTIPK